MPAKAKQQKLIGVSMTVNTGQYPEGHPQAGRWAIQIMVDSFDTEEAAAVVADRVAPGLRVLMQAPKIPSGFIAPGSQRRQ